MKKTSISDNSDEMSANEHDSPKNKIFERSYKNMEMINNNKTPTNDKKIVNNYEEIP